MRIAGKTLVACAHGFDRSLLKHIEFEQVIYVGARSNAHRGSRFKTLIWAGFTEKKPPSAELIASLTPCLVTMEGSVELFTVDGKTFNGRIMP